MLRPCAVLPFAGINIRIGGQQIAYGNISGVILFAFTILIQFCVVCFAHDLSREYDLKEPLSINKAPSSYQNALTSDGENALKKALKSKVMLFLFTMTFLCVLVCVALARNFAVLVLDVLSMSYETVTLSLVVGCIGMILICIVSIKIKIGDVAVYWIGVSSQISVITMLVFQYIMVCFHLSFSIKIVLLVLYLVFDSFFQMGELLFTVIVFSKLVSSKHQSYLESIRMILKLIGSMLGAFFSLAFLQYEVILIFLMINLIILTFLFLFKRGLMHPVVVV